MRLDYPFQALDSHASTRPGDVALRWLAGDHATELSYAELALAAERIGASLTELTDHGDRVLLMLDHALDFAKVMFGCMRSGRIAIPLAPPLGSAVESYRRAALVTRDSTAKLAVVSESLRNRLCGSLRGSELPSDPAFYVTPDELLTLSSKIPSRHADPHRIAFLQYTSGSTSSPKGVMVSHEGLADNARRIRDRFGFSPETCGLSWLPTHHDMGLIGCLVQPVITGFECTLMSPLSFVQRPLRWLRAISRYRANATGGPCFAYELCVQRVREPVQQELDLSSWTTAFIGAERVRADVLRDFQRTFAPVGFDSRAFAPCYGLAEATLMVSAQPTGAGAQTLQLSRRALREGYAEIADGEHTVELVGCGRVVDDHTVLIVDPETGDPCVDGRVGELWVSGPSVALGYYGDPQRSAATFAATTTSDTSREFLRTGDQAFLRDGELHICGRLKTLIIVRGQNYIPEDIEQMLQDDQAALVSHAGVAFSVDAAGGEQLVIVHEVQRSVLSRDVSLIVERGQRLLGEQLGLRALDFVLVKPGTIPRTTSGKLKRLACREDYLSGALSSSSHLPQLSHG
jgi:acyl-CoA synthetase (AMP-forming)/AMP-acid ligase II